MGNYHNISDFIEEVDAAIAARLEELHPFYQDKLILKAAEICGISKSSDILSVPEAYAIANAVVRMIGGMHHNVVMNLNLMSMSREELVEHERNMKRRWHRKTLYLRRTAEKARCNFRRFVGIPVDSDEVQAAYDSEVTWERERYVVMTTKGGYKVTAQASLEYRRNIRAAKFDMMFRCMDESAKGILGLSPFFL